MTLHSGRTYQIVNRGTGHTLQEDGKDNVHIHGPFEYWQLIPQAIKEWVQWRISFPAHGSSWIYSSRLFSTADSGRCKTRTPRSIAWRKNQTTQRDIVCSLVKLWPVGRLKSTDTTTSRHWFTEWNLLTQATHRIQLVSSSTTVVMDNPGLGKNTRLRRPNGSSNQLWEFREVWGYTYDKRV